MAVARARRRETQNFWPAFVDVLSNLLLVFVFLLSIFALVQFFMSREITGRDTGTWAGYLDAHRQRRAFFKSFGATSSDHGHPTAETANLSDAAARELFRL